MAKEIEAQELNHRWFIEDLPSGSKPINCEWVYKVKYNYDGSIERYRTRLIIRGAKQMEGFDYNETSAPVTMMTNVRCFLLVVVAKGWKFYQMNVDNVFLHGDLGEKVYMMLNPGFRTKDSNKARRL